MTLLSPPEASRLLAQLGVNHSVDTLNRYRCIGGGPEFVRIGRWVKYPEDRLVAYARRITTPLMRSNHEPAESGMPEASVTAESALEAAMAPA
jgi:hypothetical protein